jgi:hypothetical protein
MAKEFSFEEASKPVDQKGFSFEEALAPPAPKGFSFEEGLPPPPTLSPEEQMMGAVGQTSPGYGVTDLAKDLSKQVAAGATTGTLGAPEAIEAGAQETAKNAMFAPMETLNLLADPRILTNKLAGAINLPNIFGQTQPIVPPKLEEKQRLALQETFAKGKIPQFKQLTEFGEKVSEGIRDTLSPEMKQALADSQITGNIVKAIENRDISELSFGKDPSMLGLAGHVFNVFGSSAPALLTALITKKVGPAAAVGFGQAGSEAVKEAREHIRKMSDEQLAKDSPYFANLLVLGYDPKTARQMTEAKAGDTAAAYQGSVGALGGAFTSKLINGAFNKTLLASAKSRLGKVVAGLGVAGLEGAITETAEGIAADLGIDKTVVREIGVDSFANLLLGALGEASPGAIAGLKAPVEGQTPRVPPTAVPPTSPIAPTTPLAQGLDPEVAQRIKMRIDQIDGAQVPLAGRTVNPLAKELGLFVPKGQRPEQTYIQIKEALGLPTEPVAPTEAAVPESEVEAAEEQNIPPVVEPIAQPVSGPAVPPVSEPAPTPIAEPVSQPIAGPAAPPALPPVPPPVSGPSTPPVSGPMTFDEAKGETPEIKPFSKFVEAKTGVTFEFDGYRC